MVKCCPIVAGNNYNWCVVVKETKSIKSKQWRNIRYCLFECWFCWNVFESRFNCVKKWHTKSCWCNKYSGLSNRKHSMCWTKFYDTYMNIISRCNNPKSKFYYRYWWRWIICLWGGFEEFKDDMYESYLEHEGDYWPRNTTIERINNDWNYCKENCRRATHKEQWLNRSDNVKYLYNWEYLTPLEISSILWRTRGYVYNLYHKWKSFPVI